MCAAILRGASGAGRCPTWGFQSESNMTTVSAAVSVMPWPPARVDSRKTKPSDPSAAGQLLHCNYCCAGHVDCHDLGRSQLDWPSCPTTL